MNQRTDQDILTYDLNRFDFPTRVADLLGVSRLEQLHLTWPQPADSHGDQDTPVHQVLYAGFDQWRPLYQDFIRWCAPAGTDVCFQWTPTFRVHYPGATAVREFHLDSDYNHQAGMVNVWVPLTIATGSNTIWIEDEPNSNRYDPVELVPGQMLRFDANTLRHGNQRNRTGITRVSFDFRLLPLSQYRPDERRTVSHGVPLRLGHYYGILHRDGRINHDHQNAGQASR
jgi:ectoine hydroxylase-related dioxygenase (phytanoyl-CoA dioxygenase family)